MMHAVENPFSKKDTECVRSVEFFSEGKRLQGNIIYPEKRKNEKCPGVLFVHGLHGNQVGNVEYAKALAEKGFVGMTFDLQGHGQSEGAWEESSRDQFLQNVICAYDQFVKTPGVDANRIAVVANSMGAYLAERLTEVRAVSALVLRAPANYPDAESAQPVGTIQDSLKVQQWKKQMHDANETVALRALHQFQGDVLVIESERDAIVSSEAVQSVVKAVSTPEYVEHVVLKDAPHTLKEKKFWKMYQDVLVSWFENRT